MQMLIYTMAKNYTKVGTIKEESPSKVILIGEGAKILINERGENVMKLKIYEEGKLIAEHNKKTEDFQNIIDIIENCENNEIWGQDFIKWEWKDEENKYNYIILEIDEQDKQDEYIKSAFCEIK